MNITVYLKSNNIKKFFHYVKRGGIISGIIAIAFYFIYIILDVIREKIIAENRKTSLEENVLCSLFDSSKLFVDLSDIGFSSDIFLYNKREPRTIDYFLASLNGEDTFFDVGANMGYYSILGSRKAKRVISIEPVIRNYNLLNKNILANNLKNVSAFNIALDERSGEKNIYIPLERNWSTLYPPFFSLHSNAGIQKVTGHSLDDFLASNPQIPPPTWIKMDVEGAEYFIIKGAGVTLERYRPKILLELHFSRMDRVMLEETIDTLIKLDYSINKYFFEVTWQWYCAPLWLKKKIRTGLDLLYSRLFKNKILSLEYLKNDELFTSGHIPFIELFLGSKGKR